ncbi:ShlB/FhaC/HecB family hemolysin secretion/activation protein [Sphingomonas jaspsi]|nr:ShlB/FhaC/HecB family hemolysin secretion/activation protein [Sphingomonas jaspsi]
MSKPTLPSTHSQPSISLEGVTVFDAGDLTAAAYSRAREARDQIDADTLAATVELLYRERGFIFAEAAALRREDGSQVVEVDEGAVARLVFDGVPSRVQPSLTAILAPALSSGPVQRPPFERALALVSDLAGIQVQAELRPNGPNNDLIISGTVRRQAGVAGVEFIPARPGTAVRGFVSQELYGTAITGDLLRLTGVISREPSDSPSAALFGTYRVPLAANGTYAEVYAGNVIGRRTFDRTQAPLRLRGETAGGLLGIVVRRDLQNFLYLIAEAEYQRARSRVAGTQTESNAMSGRIHVTGGHDFPRGGIMRWALTTSVGVRLNDKVQAFTDGPRRFAHLRGDFGIVRVISRDSNITIRFDARAQLSGTTLPEVERFALGHAPFLRGYAPAEVEGDSGVSGTLEISRSFERQSAKSITSLAPFAFFSAGAAWLDQPRPTLGERRARRIASIGAGTDLRWGPWQLSGWGAIPLAAGPRTKAGNVAAYLALTRGW